MQTSIFYALSNTSQVAFYDWSMAINYLKVLTDVTTTSKSPHVLDTSTKFSGFVRNVCCVWFFNLDLPLRVRIWQRAMFSLLPSFDGFPTHHVMTIFLLFAFLSPPFFFSFCLFLINSTQRQHPPHSPPVPDPALKPN